MFAVTRVVQYTRNNCAVASESDKQQTFVWSQKTERRQRRTNCGV